MIYNIEKVSKQFQDFEVLSNIQMQIERPGIYGILGPNGAGKTTLLRTMLRILTPTEGKIYYQGTDIEKLGQEYYKEIGAVLEGNRNLYWYLSARQNLKYYGRLMNIPEREIQIRTEKLLEVMELSEQADKKVGYMSRGMQQKVAIIAALLHQPNVLFLDEPTLGLDITTKNSMVREIRNMAENGATIFLTTHQIDVLEQLTDTLFIIEKGKITYEGKTEGLINLYENTSNVEIVVNCAENIEAYLQKIFADGMLQMERENGQLKISISEASQQHVNELMKKLTEREADILSVARKRLSLEEALLKFWKGNNHG
nr:ABC transporter ATP-binding protein [uncultured Faecalimonas sp.]